MRAIAWTYATGLGLLAAYLLFEMAHSGWGWGIWNSFLLALLGGIPVLGNAAAVYAAKQVWGWSTEFGVLIFFVSIFVVSKGAELLTTGRK